MWCSPEIEKAVGKGYTLLGVHEVWHFPETKVGLLEDYMAKVEDRDLWLAELL